MVIHNVEQALVHYQTDNTDGCPKALTELVTQKYLSKEPKDAWGQPLDLQAARASTIPTAPTSVSKGKDKQEGTADDIKSWEHVTKNPVCV